MSKITLLRLTGEGILFYAKIKWEETCSGASIESKAFTPEGSTLKNRDLPYPDISLCKPSKESKWMTQEPFDSSMTIDSPHFFTCSSVVVSFTRCVRATSADIVNIILPQCSIG